MESLFYVLVWICSLYGGPNNCPRKDRSFRDTLCYNWAERAFDDHDFTLAKLSKYYFVNNSAHEINLSDLHPYFQPIFDLLQKWRRKIRDGYLTDTQLSYTEVRQVLREAYDKLCDKDETTSTVDAQARIPNGSITRGVKRRRVEELMG